MDIHELEKMAAALEAHGGYRILRKLETLNEIEAHDGSPLKTALFLDVETTGLDHGRHEVIELAMVPFTYGTDGRIFAVGEAFRKFRQPKNPIPAEITLLTGITNEMVAGQAIDPKEIADFVGEAALIIAHNAQFDRRFVEGLSPIFALKPWACSMAQVDWSGEGFEGRKLAYLTMESGYFYDKHRAESDCLAAIHLLARELPKSKQRAFSQLLEKARRSTWRIWAENAPFDLKDVLKKRGYRWNGDSNPNPRAWFIDVDETEKESELEFLRGEIYQREIDLPMRKITAFERFSIRA